ncbi:Uncharacterized protein PBTT_04439 [Plasmodiophora brassicae]|uniref:Uncharacterized protein n=1 Tax=Plasmodiophora brassicae TaxID=37360 RepID=A0A0G4J3L4_PLABS|nr:hypothetical protein PBRA_008809 [Plasmodiophora brassicae]
MSVEKGEAAAAAATPTVTLTNWAGDDKNGWNFVTRFIARCMESPEERRAKMKTVCDRAFRGMEINRRRWAMPTPRYGAWMSSPGLQAREDMWADWCQSRIAYDVSSGKHDIVV